VCTWAVAVLASRLERNSWPCTLRSLDRQYQAGSHLGPTTRTAAAAVEAEATSSGADCSSKNPLPGGQPSNQQPRQQAEAHDQAGSCIYLFVCAHSPAPAHVCAAVAAKLPYNGSASCHTGFEQPVKPVARVTAGTWILLSHRSTTTCWLTLDSHVPSSRITVCSGHFSQLAPLPLPGGHTAQHSTTLLSTAQHHPTKQCDQPDVHLPCSAALLTPAFKSHNPPSVTLHTSAAPFGLTACVRSDAARFLSDLWPGTRLTLCVTLVGLEGAFLAPHAGPMVGWLMPGLAHCKTVGGWHVHSSQKTQASSKGTGP
jgi:hypothetical protein